jgi:hypothetical protein
MRITFFAAIIRRRCPRGPGAERPGPFSRLKRAGCGIINRKQVAFFAPLRYRGTVEFEGAGVPSWQG